ncbi:MAG: GAF domain-containing protein, partial [Candidatus Firestonebacteria bacterium]
MRPPPSKHKDSKSKSLLYSALSGAVQSLKAESGAVMLIDEKTGELYTKEAFSISTPIINVPGRISKKNALGKHNASFYAAKHGKLLLINDIKTFKLENPKFYCSINPKLFKTTIIPPIMEGNKTIAVLNLYNKLGNCKFTKEDCIHAKRLADHCGAALKLEKKNFVLKTMNEITKEIHQTNDMHKVFRMIVEKGKKILNCNNVSVMMVEEGMLVVKESSDIKLLGQKREAGAGLSGWVWKTGEPVLMKKTEDASLFKFKTLNKPGSFIVAPLTLKYDNPLALNVSSKEAMTIGVLNFSDRSDSLSFNEDDLEIIVNFANLAAIALEKVKFYMEVKKAYLSTVEALAAAIDAKDKSSFSHLKRVVRFSLAIADRLGLSSKDKESIHFAALLHDVGKIGIDENILNKP